LTCARQNRRSTTAQTPVECERPLFQRIRPRSLLRPEDLFVLGDDVGADPRVLVVVEYGGWPCRRPCDEQRGRRVGVAEFEGILPAAARGPFHLAAANPPTPAEIVKSAADFLSPPAVESRSEREPILRLSRPVGRFTWPLFWSTLNKHGTSCDQERSGAIGLGGDGFPDAWCRW